MKISPSAVAVWVVEVSEEGSAVEGVSAVTEGAFRRNEKMMTRSTLHRRAVRLFIYL
jgi:hypothetical protein